jgi:hypothetical protein
MMRGMRRVVLTGVATAILIAVPQSAWANMLFSNTAFWAHYPVISASGTGTLTQAGTGYAQGQVTGGKAQVQGSVTVAGAIKSRKWNAAGTVETIVAQPGKTLYVSTSGKSWWRFVLTGKVSIAGWVRGSATAVGTGGYTVGGHRHAWSTNSPLRISTQ